MLTEPDDLDRSEIRRVLEHRWGVRAARLDYLAVGFGSHHWSAVDAGGGRSFVTADDLEATFRTVSDADAAFAGIDRAFRTAATLRDEAGLEFVLAPLFDRDRALVHRVSERYAISVAPLIEGQTSEYGPYEHAAERQEMAAILGRLHAATDKVPRQLPRSEDFAIPSRTVLVDALHDLERSWKFGPFAEEARRLLQGRAPDLHRRLVEFDAVATRVVEESGSWVVTHGEPHRGNVIRDRHGGLLLVDWDTTMVAPRERDLHMVLDEDLTGWREYSDHAGVASLNRDVLKLYQSLWGLADIASFVAVFRRPHERTEDTMASWKYLVSNLAALS